MVSGGKAWTRMLALAGVLALTACGSVDYVDKGPMPGAADTGTYPLLGKKLQPATDQMSDGDAAAMGAQLSKYGKAQSKAPVSDAEYRKKMAAMKKLADDTRAATQDGGSAPAAGQTSGQSQN